MNLALLLELADNAELLVALSVAYEVSFLLLKKIDPRPGDKQQGRPHP